MFLLFILNSMASSRIPHITLDFFSLLVIEGFKDSNSCIDLSGACLTVLKP